MVLLQTTLRDRVPGKWKPHPHDRVEGTPPQIQSTPLDHSPQRTPPHPISIAGPFPDGACGRSSAAIVNGADATRKLDPLAVLVEYAALAWMLYRKFVLSDPGR